MSAAKCVHQKHTRYGLQQCSRAAKVDGYCAQHHPDAVTARRVASNAKFKAEFDAQLEQAAKAAARVQRGKDALEALAVPGVASLLAHLAISLSMQTDTGSRVGSKWMISDEERASLATLAKIARGE